MKYHFVYITVNLVNGKWYIGKHTTSVIDDNYKGSGKIIRRAVEKYGEENFRCEIIRFFETADDAFDYEKELVTESVVKDQSSYNIRPGGSGGFSDVDRIKARQVIATTLRGKSFEERYGHEKSVEMKKNLSEKGKLLKGRSNYWLKDKTYEEIHGEEKANDLKLVRRNKCHWLGADHAGSKNSNFGNTWSDEKKKALSVHFKNSDRNKGTFWVTDGLMSVKLKSGDSIPEGFRKGRVIKRILTL